MKNKKSYVHSPKLVLIVALMLVMAITAACGNNNANNTPTDPGTNAPAPAPEPDNTNTDPEPEPAPEEPAETETPPVGEGNDPNEPAAKMDEGRFVGIMDTHSIEIETADGPTAFQYDEAMTETINSIEPDAQVQFEYVEETQDVDGEQVTQLWLVSIEEVQ